MKKFLSLKGGGIRGAIQAYALRKLEEATGKRIHELFNLIGGTSTGGLLALILTTGDYTAEEAGELYLNHGKNIFSRSPWQRISSGGGSLDEKYNHEELVLLLKTYFTETRKMGSLERRCPE